MPFLLVTHIYAPTSWRFFTEADITPAELEQGKKLSSSQTESWFKSAFLNLKGCNSKVGHGVSLYYGHHVYKYLYPFIHGHRERLGERAKEGGRERDRNKEKMLTIICRRHVSIQ